MFISCVFTCEVATAFSSHSFVFSASFILPFDVSIAVSHKVIDEMAAVPFFIFLSMISRSPADFILGSPNRYESQMCVSRIII